MTPARRPPTERSVFTMSKSTMQSELPAIAAKISGFFTNSSSSTGPTDFTGPCFRKDLSDTSGRSVRTLRSILFVLASCFLVVCLRRAARPITSSIFRYPSLARMCRVSSATNWKKVTTCSGVPGKRLRSSSFWVVMPTGQLLVWQTRAIMHPSATMAMVPKPYSSAPNRAAIITSHPDFKPPSTRRSTRSRKPFCIKVRCTSVKPSSQGLPACLMELRGDAPVPPS
mmetsp:Transcript_30564/g.40375  ORF Transcript_30564/g.40375 Transcript_30564/m.40375 type:complete len:227 (-) Transcript_30564:3696-4376(-)